MLFLEPHFKVEPRHDFFLLWRIYAMYIETKKRNAFKKDVPHAKGNREKF